MCAGGFIITHWMWKNGPAARRLPAHHRGQRRTGGRKEEPPLVPVSFKVFIPAAVYLQRGRCAGVGRCPAPGHPWCQLPRGRERANPWLFAASGGSNCLLHPQALPCCSLTLLQLRRVPQMQSPFPSLCSLLPGALLICSRFLPQLL